MGGEEGVVMTKETYNQSYLQDLVLRIISLLVDAHLSMKKMEYEPIKIFMESDNIGVLCRWHAHCRSTTTIGTIKTNYIFDFF